MARVVTGKGERAAEPHGNTARGLAQPPVGDREMIEVIQLWEQGQLRTNASKFQRVIKDSKIISKRVGLRGSFSVATKGSLRPLACYLWLSITA